MRHMQYQVRLLGKQKENNLEIVLLALNILQRATLSTSLFRTRFLENDLIEIRIKTASRFIV